MATQASELGASATCSQERDVQDSSAPGALLYKHRENPTNVEKIKPAILSNLTASATCSQEKDVQPRNGRAAEKGMCKTSVP